MPRFKKPFKYSENGIKVTVYSGECDAPDEVVKLATELGYIEKPKRAPKKKAE